MDIWYYNGEHNVLFGNTNNVDSEGYVNTDLDMWNDLELAPASRPVVVPPSVRNKTIEIEGANGDINLNNFLTGYPLYGNRTGTLEFIFVNNKNWYTTYNKIQNYFHGQIRNMVLADDPDYFYTGVFTVSNFESEDDYTTLTIDYDLQPFKYLRTGQYITLAGSQSYTLTPTLEMVQPTSPIIETTLSNASTPITLIFTNQELNINSEIRLYNGITKPGPNVVVSGFQESNSCSFSVDGSGSCVIKYREAIL